MIHQASVRWNFKYRELQFLLFMYLQDIFYKFIIFIIYVIMFHFYFYIFSFIFITYFLHVCVYKKVYETRYCKSRYCMSKETAKLLKDI
jgi:hypothetical protein